MWIVSDPMPSASEAVAVIRFAPGCKGMFSTVKVPLLTEAAIPLTQTLSGVLLTVPETVIKFMSTTTIFKGLVIYTIGGPGSSMVTVVTAVLIPPGPVAIIE